MAAENSFDARELRRLARSSEAFRNAAVAWLEVHERRSDLGRSGTRPTIRQRADADSVEVARLAAEVERWAQDAEVAFALTGRLAPRSNGQWRNPASEWPTMTTKGTINADDLTVYGIANSLERLADREDRGLPIFPVPDPRVLHPYVWRSNVVGLWIQEDYSEIPADASMVTNEWGRRIIDAQPRDAPEPRYPDGVGFWQGLFSAQDPVERQPRLQVPDYGDPKRTAARQHALGEALSGLEALSRGYKRLFGREGGTPPLQMDQVAGWLHAWSTLAFLLEECTLLLPESHSLERTPTRAIPPSPPPNPLVIVDERCFAPIPHPQIPEVYIGAAENIAVTTTADQHDLTRALQAAANRLTLVDGDGVEHPDVDTMLREAYDLHTPSWAGIVTLEDRPTLYVDSEGVIEEAMGATMRAILRDELTRHLPDATARPL